MRLRDLPRPAVLLVIGVYVAGGAAAATCLFLPPPRDVVSATVFIVLAFFVAQKRVKIHPDVASISLGFVLVFAALFRCGTVVGMATAVVNTLACYLFNDKDERQPSLLATGYNAASLALAAFAAGGLYSRVLLSGAEAGLPWTGIWATAAAIGAYHGLSVASLGLISTLYRLELDVKRWWGELLGTAPIYLAGGALAFALDQAIVHAGRWVLIVGLPFAYIIHRAYKTQADKARHELRFLEERAEASEKMARLYLAVVEALSNAIDMKDHRTLEHVQRVHSLARAVADRIGLTGDEAEAVKIGAVLHDIGKLAVPDEILRKPGRLTDAEFRLVKEHAAAGEAILRPIDFGVPVAGIIRHHHEKLDGSGYPDGLSGDQISLGARVLAVIDVYDALVSDRPYRKAWTSEMALEQLRKEAGASFDPVVVEALASVIEAGVLEQVEEASTGEAALDIPSPEALELGLHDELIASRVAQEARRCVLQGLIEFAADGNDALAAVAYEVSPDWGEMDAVAAVGPSAPQFGLLRLPVGVGVSGRAAGDGVPVSGSASGEFEGFLGGVPAGLTSAFVTAVPVTGSRGQTLAVVSLYHADAGQAGEVAQDGAIAAAASLAARQLELIYGATDDAQAYPAAEVAFAGSAAGG